MPPSVPGRAASTGGPAAPGRPADACEAGVLGDAVVVLEPTSLELLLGGVGFFAGGGLAGPPGRATPAGVGT
jgi:hypothetical protein